MLTRVYIDNFRCLSNFELRPARINLLLGPNGSGKSSFFDVITAIVGLMRDGREIAELLPASTLTSWDNRREQRFELDVHLSNANKPHRYLLRVDQDVETGRSAIVEERVTKGEKTLYLYADGQVHLYNNAGREGAQFPFRPTRSFIAELEPRPENSSLINMREFLFGARILRLNPASTRSVSEEEAPRLERDGKNFASWYRHLVQERAGELHSVFAELREVVPGFRQLKLLGAGNQGRTKDLLVELDGPSGEPYPIAFQDLSDGQRVLIVLYALLVDIRRSSTLLLLDEPENYLSLTEIQPWLSALDQALGDHGQLLLISHHPEVIDFLAAERPLLFARDGLGPVRVGDPGFDRESGLKASEQVVRGLTDGK
ncbi:MAG: AAA family ATPase [Myxococcales bacterium]|nr:AAA family ATPase [Myxococcales bacterium]